MPQDLRFVIPPTGEPLDRARLVCWRVQPGETFAVDDVLLEIETDKSVIEIPSPYAGRLLEHLVAVDGRIDADTAVAVLSVEGEVVASPGIATAPAGPRDDGATAPAGPRDDGAADEARHGESAQPTKPSPSDPQARVRITPAARQALRARGLSLTAVRGTGPEGRITLADVRRAVPSVAGAPTAAPLAHQVWSPPSGRMAGSGEPPTVVLLHGLFADVAAWTATAQGLSRAGLRALAIDLPGHGASTATAESLDDVVAACARTLEALDVAGAVLVGHSFGAAVAARLAAQRPSVASALVLLSPLGLGTEITQSFLDGVLQSRNAQAMGRELGRLTVDGARPSTAYLEALCQRVQSGAAGWQRLIDSVAVHGVQQVDIRPDLATVAVPTALIHGRGDAIIPWQHALQAPPAVALHLVPGVGHMPQWEASALTQAIITRAAQRNRS